MRTSLGENWRAVAAAEVFNEDGPFIHLEGYDRFNAYAKVTSDLDEMKTRTGPDGGSSACCETP